MSLLIHRGPQGPGPSTTIGPQAAPATAPPPIQRGRTVVLAAITVAALAVIAAGTILAMRAVTHHPRPVSASSALRGTAFMLRPGQCFNSAPNGITAAHPLPCAQPHRGEIFAVFALAGARWPGAAAVASRARAGCQSKLSSYVNPQLAAEGLAEIYVYPDEGAWLAGEHRVVCEVRSTQGAITGSVRT
jgi:Septum formation